MIRKIIYFLLATIVFGGLAALIAFYAFDFKPKMIAQAIGSMPPPVQTVATENATAETWQPTISGIGTVVATESVTVTPEVGGIVKELLFKSGDVVKAGTKLVQLDTETDAADLKSAQAQLENANAKLKRSEAIFERGFGTAATLDEDRSARDQVVATIERIQAQINKKAIYAPWDGQLGLREVSVGSYLSPGQGIATLQKVDEVFVDFAVTENDFGRVKIGQKITATFNAWPGQTFEGSIATADAKLNASSRTITIRGKLANPENKLVPGMYADVAVESGEPRSVTTIAQTAVTFSLYGDSVFAVVPATTVDKNAKPDELAVEKRFIKVGAIKNGRVEIVDGVKAGEQVVVAGQNKIDQGSKIVINNSLALKVSDETTLR
ncbi:MAG: efflux RND transporter periplasmic adaptor subunit [Proteobacteria bacterium]|nr:efflux RND transporter periplasmic adaptor subunit [Pseudomonadota bacterium]